MFFTHECERMHLPPKQGQWQGRGMTTRRQGDKVGRPLKVFSTFDGNGFVVALLLESRKMWEIHGNNFSLLKALKVAVAESRSRSRL